MAEPASPTPTPAPAPDLQALYLLIGGGGGATAGAGLTGGTMTGSAYGAVIGLLLVVVWRLGPVLLRIAVGIEGVSTHLREASAERAAVKVAVDEAKRVLDARLDDLGEKIDHLGETVGRKLERNERAIDHGFAQVRINPWPPSEPTPRDQHPALPLPEKDSDRTIPLPQRT